MKTKFLLVMAAPWLLLAACEKNDETADAGGSTGGTPVTFTASIQPETETRSTVNNGWTGITDGKMGVSVDGTVKEYAVNELGEVTSTDPFYWGSKDTLTVDAWYPYNNGVKPDVLTVSADQSVAANYEASDYLEVVQATVTQKAATLTFTHRTAKLIFTLASTYEENVDDARIILHNLTGVDSGTSVTTTSQWRALIVPQEITGGTNFVEIVLGENENYYYAPTTNQTFQKACAYQIDLTITPDGVEAVIVESSSWIGDAETMTDGSPTGNVTGSDSSWSGSSEDSEGSSPEGNTNDSNGGWSGSSETSAGSSPQGSVSGSSGWTGDSEDVQATTSEG